MSQLNEKTTNTTEGSSSSDDLDAIIPTVSKSNRADSNDSSRSFGMLVVASLGAGADLGSGTMKKVVNVTTIAASKAADSITTNLASSRCNSTDEPEGWRQQSSLQSQPSDVLMMRDSVNWLFEGAGDEDSPTKR